MFWNAFGPIEIFQSGNQMISKLYLWLNLGSVLIPFIFTFHPRLRFDKKFKAFFPALMLSALLYLMWDVPFTMMGFWGFNADYLMEFRWFHLPIEEVLFFLCIPYACVFSHYTMVTVKPDQLLTMKTTRIINIILIVLLSILSVTCFDKAYTLVNALCTLIILLTTMMVRPQLLRKFYLTYLVLLIQFLMVDGILTGSLIDAPIVWYNDAENLGIRIFTIPIEDVFYGMGLILLNLLLTEVFLTLSKSPHQTPSYR